MISQTSKQNSIIGNVENGSPVTLSSALNVKVVNYLNVLINENTI